MEEFFREIPKAELHLHLEGAIWPETLLEIDPSLEPGQVESRYHYADFLGFIETFKWVLGFLRGPDEYALATRHLCERLAAEGVRYAEITFAGAGILKRGLDFGRVFDAIDRETQRSQVDVRWIVDATRQFPAEEAMEVARLAVERAPRVVAFGLGGIEGQGPVEQFAEAFRFAREQGLRLAPHAGETVGAESVRATLELGPNRIGHGIRAADDPALLELLAERGVPLDICISSNIATGAVAALVDHPVRRIYDAGVPITLNTDDPAMFHTSLSREFSLAAKHLSFSREELERIAQNAFRYSFA